MQVLIWAGAALTLVGLIGLVYCILRAARAKRAGLDDAAMRAELQSVVVINLAAVALSALGLAAVV
ncbi:MAG: hypothetical protein WBP15_12990, partial [Tabrizicola sp.]